MRIRLPRKRLLVTVPFLIAAVLLAVSTSQLRTIGANTPLFLPTVSYESGGQSFSVTVSDVNGDGKADVLVTNAGFAEGSVGVLLGRGDGTFEPVVTYGSGGSIAYSVAVADVNGDGKPDLLVANCGPIGVNACSHGNGVIGVLLGNGDGTFQPVVTYDPGGIAAIAVVVADVNGDGKPDLLVANECGTSTDCGRGSVGVLQGKGDGTFQAAKIYDVGYAVNSLAVADVNGDGKLDLLVANGGINNNVGALLGNGDGTFQPVVAYDSGGNTALSLVVADVNGDGNLDLLVANQCDMSNNCANGSVGVLLGNGDGTFQRVVSYGSGGSGVWGLAVADVNGDGTPDLLDASYFYNTVGVLLGNGDGTFHAVTTYGSGGSGPRSIAVADLNGDGKSDVVVANWCAVKGCPSGRVGVLLNSGIPLDIKPPMITLSATPKLLWPPNGRMVPVRISGTITDIGTGVNEKTATFVVTGEYGNVQPKGTIPLGASGSYSFSVLLQASRLGTDKDGRQYTITVQASDNAGNRGSKTTVVTVPHNQGH